MSEDAQFCVWYLFRRDYHESHFVLEYDSPADIAVPIQLLLLRIAIGGLWFFYAYI